MILFLESGIGQVCFAHKLGFGFLDFLKHFQDFFDMTLVITMNVL